MMEFIFTTTGEKMEDLGEWGEGLAISLSLSSEGKNVEEKFVSLELT